MNIQNAQTKALPVDRFLLSASTGKGLFLCGKENAMNLPKHNPQNKTAAYNGKNYKQIFLPEHPNATRQGGLLYEHRYLAAKALGKALPKGVEVHHHDGGMSGGQLILCENRAFHRLLHTRTKAYRATGDANKKQCPFCHQWDDKNNLIAYFCSSHPNGRFHHEKCKQDYERNYCRKVR